MRELIVLSVSSARVCNFSCFFALRRKNLMVTLQEVDTNESTVAVAIKGPPTTIPITERAVASPEPARMVATPPVNAHAVWQCVCHRLNLAEVLQ